MQKLQLSIPEPCHENWHHMTPTDQGRFCNACAKEVVDFSMMTDTEVLKYITSLSHEKICGRALPSQLNRTIIYPKEPEKRLFWYWNYIVMFFMFFSKSNTARSQGGIKPVTELIPVKPADVNNYPVSLIGDTIISSSRVVSGKVTDIDGNPVSFATIKIKGTASGLSADANGAYSVKVKPDDVLLVSGASFKEVGIPIGTDSAINIILEKGLPSGFLEIVVTPAFQKHNALFKVTDDISGLPIDRAKIIIAKADPRDTIIAFSDNKGVYKLKGIKQDENYFVKVEADGYGVNEFTITGADFDDRKKVWELLLTRQEAMLPVKTLDTVLVPASQRLVGQLKTVTTCTTSVMGDTIISEKVKSNFTDSLQTIISKINGSIKIYPNPVLSGNSLNISLKLKQTGDHVIQVSDAAGRIVFQKQMDAASKEHTEKIQADNRWSGGVYYIRVFDNRNQLISKSSFIVQ